MRGFFGMGCEYDLSKCTITFDCESGYENENNESCKAIRYSIEYELNGGTNHSSNPLEYTIEKSVTLNNPTRSNSVFRGWFTDSELFVPAGNPQIPIGQTGPRSFYAGWSCDTGFRHSDDRKKCEKCNNPGGGVIWKKDSATECETALCPRGYFCTGDAVAVPCPGGMTSPGGSDAKTDCAATGGPDGTRFCEGTGAYRKCFTLPAGVKILSVTSNP